MEPIKVNKNPDAEDMSLEELLKALPAKLHHCGTYGLQMQINGDEVNWCVRYYTWCGQRQITNSILKYRHLYVRSNHH